MSLVPTSPDSPIIKVGAVVLRADGAVLIHQPRPKKSGDVPAFVLARGSRQYQDATGDWIDARDLATAIAHRDALEPFTRTLKREVEEEAGVSEEMLGRAKVREMGTRDFQSRTKGIYPIHWFVVKLTPEDAQTVVTQPLPREALSIRWAGVDEIKAMATRGEFSAGYVPVIEEATRSKPNRSRPQPASPSR